MPIKDSGCRGDVGNSSLQEETSRWCNVWSHFQICLIVTFAGARSQPHLNHLYQLSYLYQPHLSHQYQPHLSYYAVPDSSQAPVPSVPAQPPVTSTSLISATMQYQTHLSHLYPHLSYQYSTTDPRNLFALITKLKCMGGCC